MKNYFKNILIFIKQNPILEVLTCFALIIQTFIIYNQITPTEEQAAAAKFEQAEKARERLNAVVEIIIKFSEINKILGGNFGRDIYCNGSCSNIKLAALYPFLKDEDFFDIDEYAFYNNAMRLSRNSKKGASEIYLTYIAFQVKLKNYLIEDKESLQSMSSELKNILKEAKLQCQLDSDVFKDINVLVDTIEPLIRKIDLYHSKTLDGIVEEMMLAYYVRNINSNLNSKEEFYEFKLQDFRNSIEKNALSFSVLTNQVIQKCEQQVKKYENSLRKFD